MRLAVTSNLQAIPLTKEGLSKSYLTMEKLNAFEVEVLKIAPSIACNYIDRAWEYMVVGNGAIYIRPAEWRHVEVKYQLKTDSLNTLSRDAFGLVVSLMSLSVVFLKQVSEGTAILFDELLEFVDQHPEGQVILSAIDGIY